MALLPRAASVFRYLGDILMISSRVILIRKIQATRSVSGLSFRSQFLYLVAYIFRYLDIFTLPGSTFPKQIYLFTMKFLFISFQLAIIYLILGKFGRTYNRRFDNFSILVPIVTSLAIAVFVKGETFNIMDYIDELLYTASLIIESVAILPQLSLIQEAGESESLTASHIMLLGLYRLCYVIHFVLKSRSRNYMDTVLIITGILQTLLYAEFYIVYYKRFMERFNLPFSNSRRKI